MGLLAVVFCGFCLCVCFDVELDWYLAILVWLIGLLLCVHFDFVWVVFVIFWVFCGLVVAFVMLLVKVFICTLVSYAEFVFGVSFR